MGRKHLIDSNGDWLCCNFMFDFLLLFAKVPYLFIGPYSSHERVSVVKRYWNAFKQSSEGILLSFVVVIPTTVRSLSAVVSPVSMNFLSSQTHNPQKWSSSSSVIKTLICILHIVMVQVYLSSNQKTTWWWTCWNCKTQNKWIISFLA